MTTLPNLSLAARTGEVARLGLRLQSADGVWETGSGRVLSWAVLNGSGATLAVAAAAWETYDGIPTCFMQFDGAAVTALLDSEGEAVDWPGLVVESIVGGVRVHASVKLKISRGVDPDMLPGEPGTGGAPSLMLTLLDAEDVYTLRSVGADGRSAYQMAVDAGFEGDFEAWQESLIGPANTLAVGTVTTGAPGSDAEVEITGDAPNQTVNFTLPAGENGSPNTLTVGTVTTSAPGGDAEVEITGDAPNQTVNFTLPAGETGEPNTLTVGTVTTSAPGGDAEVEITGSAPAQTVNFVLPAGDTGERGLSAYQVAQIEGFEGTEEEWLATLVGPTGTGQDGAPGAGLNPAGTWFDDVNYVQYRLVEHNGSSWWATTANIDSEPTEANSDWQLFAGKGGTGNDGNDGADGMGYAEVPYGVPAGVFTDSAGYVVMRFTATTFEHPVIDAMVARNTASAPALYAGQGQGGVVGVDAAGYLGWGIHERRIRHVEADTWRADVKRRAIPARDAAEDAVQAWAKIVQFFGYGQSLGLGYDNGSPVTVAVSQLPLLYALRFAGGARPIDLSLDPLVAYADMRPYRERPGLVRRDPFNPTGTVGAANLVETPMGGALQMAAQLLLDEDGIDLTAGTGQQLLGSVYGQPGTHVRGLMPDSIAGPGPYIGADYYYADLLRGAQYGQSLSAAATKSWQPLSLYFCEGEQDTQIATSQATYQTQVQALHDKFESDVQALTGNSAPINWVLTQMASHLHYGYATPSMALATYELAKLADFGLSAPNYILTHYSDGVHLLPPASRIMGLYIGLHWKRRHFDGVKPKMTRPSAIARHGTDLIVDFECPGDRIVLDSRFTGPASVANYGLQVVTSAAAAVTINAVEQVARKRLRLRCATDPGAGGKLRHGWLGTAATATGGIRDDQGERVVFDPTGVNYALHSWAPIFEETFA